MQPTQQIKSKHKSAARARKKVLFPINWSLRTLIVNEITTLSS